MFSRFAGTELLGPVFWIRLAGLGLLNRVCWVGFAGLGLLEGEETCKLGVSKWGLLGWA